MKKFNLLALVILVSGNLFSSFNYAQVENPWELRMVLENAVDFTDGNQETPENKVRIRKYLRSGSRYTRK